MKLVRKLNTNGFYYSKDSISCLIPEIYKSTNQENQTELLNMY